MGSCYSRNISEIGSSNTGNNGKGAFLGSCCRGSVDSVGSSNIGNGKGSSLGPCYSRSIDDIGSSNKGYQNGNSGFENTLVSLAENENVVEAFSDLQSLANADLSTLSGSELCKLLKFLSCFFCKR